MKRVEIFSVGNELLRGIVQDTNSHWLAVRAMDVIGEALREICRVGQARLCGRRPTIGSAGGTALEDSLARGYFLALLRSWVRAKSMKEFDASALGVGIAHESHKSHEKKALSSFV